LGWIGSVAKVISSLITFLRDFIHHLDTMAKIVAKATRAARKIEMSPISSTPVVPGSHQIGASIVSSFSVLKRVIGGNTFLLVYIKSFPYDLNELSLLGVSSYYMGDGRDKKQLDIWENNWAI
jgi:hypothetical protein